MKILSEGNLQIKLPGSVKRSWKFDDPGDHGISHCMKAVDFIIELKDRFLFIEIKDPEDPRSKAENREKFFEEFQSGRVDEDLKYKFRDSFLYFWASEEAKKPIYYQILIAIEKLTEAELMARTEALAKKIPLRGPSKWSRQLVSGISVFNIRTWNAKFPQYRIKRKPSRVI